MSASIAKDKDFWDDNGDDDDGDDDEILAFTCWLTRQCEGPWWMRMRTMSTSPRQAARCSGKQPLLSATFVDASNWSSFSTTSLRQTETCKHIQINVSTDRRMEGWRRGRRGNPYHGTQSPSLWEHILTWLCCTCWDTAALEPRRACVV